MLGYVLRIWPDAVNPSMGAYVTPSMALHTGLLRNTYRESHSLICQRYGIQQTPPFNCGSGSGICSQVE